MAKTNLNGKKIVITTGGGIGDSIMFTPALRRMKELYPDCHITFVTRYPNQRLLEGLSYIDKLVYIKRGTLTSRLRVLPDLLGADAVVFTDWQPQLLLAAKWFGIPLIAGYPREGHKLSKYLTKHIKPFVMTSPDFAAETNAKVFSDALSVDIAGDMTKTDVSETSREEEEQVKELLKKMGIGKDYIVLSAFAALPERNWPMEQAIEFAERFEQEYKIPVLWTGSSGNMVHVKGKVRESRNLLGKTTVGEMIALLKYAKCWLRRTVALCTSPEH